MFRLASYMFNFLIFRLAVEYIFQPTLTLFSGSLHQFRLKVDATNANHPW